MHRLAIALVAAVLTPAAAAQSAPAPQPFAERFDGRPSAPAAWDPPGWDVAVHSRDLSTWERLEATPAHHGPGCAGHPAVHQTSGSYADAVFACNDHVMTSIAAEGYGAIYLTPDRLADWSSGEAVIRFDISTLVTSKRDWWDLWISPFETHLQLPLQDGFPDLAGPPQRALNVRLDPAARTLVAAVYDGHAETVLPGRRWQGYETFLTPSAVRRDTVEVRISSNRLVVTMPGYGVTWVDTPVDLDWTRGVVQFGHHSYNPTKDDVGDGPHHPNTWHWDNVELRPAVPFTMVEAQQRFVRRSSSTKTVSLPAPAPSGGRLRFSAMAASIDVSFDGGATWQRAQRPPQANAGNGLLFSNYWTPIPAGVTSVQFRGDGGWIGDWIAKDIAVWSTGAGTPTPTTPTTVPPAATTTTAHPGTAPPVASTTTTTARTSTTTTAATTTTQPTGACPDGSTPRRPGRWRSLRGWRDGQAGCVQPAGSVRG